MNKTSDLELLRARAEELGAIYKAELARLEPIRDAAREADKAYEDALRDAGQLYVLHYMRYYAPCTEEFRTAEEAIQYAEYAEDAGEMSAQKVTGPDGYLLEGDALRDAMWASRG